MYIKEEEQIQSQSNSDLFKITDEKLKQNKANTK